MSATALSDPLLSPGPATRAAIRLAPRLWMLLVLGVGGTGLAFVSRHPVVFLTLLVIGLTFLAGAGMVLVLASRHRRVQSMMSRAMEALVADDDSPTLGADRVGHVHFANSAAWEAFQAEPGQTMAEVLSVQCAQPTTVIYRLQNRALALGAAHEDVPIRGGRLSISVHRSGPERFVWRIEETGEDRAPGHSGDDIGLPMMTVTKTGTVLYMNDALRQFLGGRETSLDRVINDLPLRPGGVHIAQGARGPVQVQVIEVALSAGRRELYLAPDTRQDVVAEADWRIADALPVPILKLDREGRVGFANARAKRLLGAEQLIGRPLADLIEGLGRPLDDWLTEAWSGRNLGQVQTGSATLPAEDTYVQIQLDRVRDDDGAALIAVLNDATELKSLETQFVQSQKMQAIGQLAGGVAHDFNNLLTAISGHCDLLLLRHDKNDRDFADLHQISQNANRAAALVEQLLSFSRKQTLKPDVIDLSESMSDMVHLLGRLVGERITLEHAHDSALRTIRADRRQLEQVVMNLVVNARDAMPKGGTIKLDLRNIYLDRPLERDRVRVPPGDYVAIRVIDGGHGIPRDKVSKIFEPFFTTKGAGKGTGLGLSMAYGFVKQSGGFIFVDSVEGSGTTFTLYFPVYQASESSDAALLPVASDGASPNGAVREVPDGGAPKDQPGIKPSADATPPRPKAQAPKPTHSSSTMRGGTILLVEDEAPVRAFASRALQLRGYDVIEADSAEAALELLTDPKLVVDVVVTDIVMPGLDGPTWVGQALEDRPGVKVVFVSGYAEESVTDQHKRIPNSVFLPKPFSLSELTETVAAQIH